MNINKSEIIQVGVAGLGHRGLGTIDLLQSFAQCRVVAVCDKQTALLETAVAKFADRGVRGYRDFTAMLEHPRLDGIIIETDPTTQADLAVQAMETGLHVITEVPACMTLDDCWKLVLAVERTGRIYQLAEQTRYWGFVQAWKKMVEEGQLGKILYAEGEYLHYIPQYFFCDLSTGRYVSPAEADRPGVAATWRERMHSIAYLPHTLSPLLSIIDDRVTEVTGMATRPRSYSLDNVAQSDVEVALMKTAGDTVMRVMASFSSPAGDRGETGYHWYQVRGTKGAVEWKRSRWDKPKLWMHDDDNHSDWTAMPWGTDAIDAPPEALASGHGGADYYPYKTWFDAILNNTAPPMDVYKSVETAAPAAAAIESIERGTRLVKVPDFRPGSLRATGIEPATRGF